MSHDRIRALVALAVDQGDTEEGRTAAVVACRMIASGGMLDRLSASSHVDPSTWVPSSMDPVIQEILRANEARAAVERAEYMQRSTDGRTWVKRVCLRRSFCRMCRSFIDEGAVMFSQPGHDRCLACDESAEAIAKGAEQPSTRPAPAPTRRASKTRITKLGAAEAKKEH